MLDYKITLEQLHSIDDLTEILVKENYKVHRFEDGDLLLERLGLSERAKAALSFTYTSNDLNCIFISRALSDRFAAEMALHELAHIRLGHLENGSAVNLSDEAEADLFVSYVPELISELSNHRQTKIRNYILFAFTAICVITVLIGFIFINVIQPKDDSTAASISFSETEPISEQVFITKFGKKYHKQDCSHIKNSDAIAISVDIAQNAGYEPCKDCFDG